MYTILSDKKKNKTKKEKKSSIKESRKETNFF